MDHWWVLKDGWKIKDMIEFTNLILITGKYPPSPIKASTKIQCIGLPIRSKLLYCSMAIFASSLLTKTTWSDGDSKICHQKRKQLCSAHSCGHWDGFKEVVDKIDQRRFCTSAEPAWIRLVWLSAPQALKSSTTSSLVTLGSRLLMRTRKPWRRIF